MTTEDVRLDFGIDVDSQGAVKAQQEIDRLEQAQVDLARSFAQGEISAKEAADGQKKYDKQIRDVRKNLDLLTRSQREQAKAAEESARATEKAAKAEEKAAKAAERAAKARGDARTERREGIADKAGSGSSAQAQVRGALEVLGGSAGESIAPILEAGEGITDLAEVAVNTLGPAGLAVGAVVAGMAILVGQAQQAQAEINQVVAAELDQRKDIALRAADGTLTLAQAEDERNKILDKQAVLTGLVKQAEQDREAAFQESLNEFAGAGIFADAFARIDQALGLNKAPEFEKEIEELNAELREGEGAVAAYDSAIKSGKLANDDAANSTQNAANANNQAASAAQNAASAQNDVSSAYNKSASASKEFGSAAENSAKSAQSAASSIGTAFKNIERQSGELKRGGLSGRSSKGVGGTIFSLGGKKKKASGTDPRGSSTGSDSSNREQAVKDLNDTRKKIADAINDFNQEQFKLVQDFNRETAKENREARDELARIRSDADKSETDALRNRNFLVLANAREEEAQKVNEFNTQRAIDRREREITLRERQTELRAAHNRELADLRAVEREKMQVQLSFQKASLTGWGQFFQNLQQMQSSLGRGGRSNPSRRTQGNNQSKQLRNLTSGRPQFGVR